MWRRKITWQMTWQDLLTWRWCRCCFRVLIWQVSWCWCGRWHGEVNFSALRAFVSFFPTSCNLLSLLTAMAQETWLCDPAWDRRCNERGCRVTAGWGPVDAWIYCHCWRQWHCGRWQMKIYCAAFAVVNHQSMLAVMGLWVTVAGGFVMLVWLLKPKIYWCLLWCRPGAGLCRR